MTPAASPRGERKPKRRVFEVRPQKWGEGWEVIRRDDKDWFKVWSTKARAIKSGVRVARENQPSQLVIRLRNGRIQSERTYPRSSDPRRSKG